MKPEELKGMNGRRVLIEGALNSDATDDDGEVVIVIARADGQREHAFVLHSAIKEILPEPVKVGSMVKAAGIGGVAEVRHIDGEYAWLLYHASGIRNDAPLSDLTLVEPGK